MNVLVTRPDSRGEQLVEMLAKQHIFAIHQPLFRLEAGRELSQLPSALSRLNSGDYVFAVSKNAVDFADDTLNHTGFKWRSDLHYFAVGQGTAQHFAARSEQAVRYPLKSANSEGLLALPIMQDLADKTVLILRADSGRAFFAEQARQRGANVQIIECYQRVKLDTDLAERLSLAKRAGIDTIIATSGDILTFLAEQTAETEQAWLKACRLVVVGKRGAAIARQLGWQAENILISNQADNHSLFEMLNANR